MRTEIMVYRNSLLSDLECWIIQIFAKTFSQMKSKFLVCEFKTIEIEGNSSKERDKQ